MKRIIPFLILFVSIIALWYGYRSLYADNISGDDDIEFYIPTGTSYEQVLQNLAESGILENKAAFDMVARKMKYPELIKPGRYSIDGNMSNRKLLIMFRNGEQKPIKLVIHNERTIEDLCGKIANYLEPDSSTFLSYFNEPENLTTYGFTRENLMTAFIPNTYEFYWNTTPGQFFERMLHEKSRFWNEERKTKAMNIGLSETDVFVLASIVEQEISIQSEAERIAGVYLNRLNRNMLLQADPTVKFAIGQFDLRRILNEHLETESPYNTYKYKGLPPGPICLPSIKTIDAVLNAENHSYYYFCANADLSGAHKFSKTYNEHLQHASEYRNELNKNKIYR